MLTIKFVPDSAGTTATAIFSGVKTRMVPFEIEMSVSLKYKTSFRSQLLKLLRRYKIKNLVVTDFELI